VSRGKYLSLPEARKKKQLDRFAKEHQTEGDADELDRIIGGMAKTPESTDQTSPKKSNRED
jgi:hypothetical protein